MEPKTKSRSGISEPAGSLRRPFVWKEAWRKALPFARPVRRQALSLYYLTASVIRWFDLSDGDGLTSRLANSHPLQMIISLEIRASSSA